ncbi:MAG TPA: inorganic phosphate transporter [Opitutaceae bacterium]|jgi:PiT family inorganic phosphate transporter
MTGLLFVLVVLVMILVFTYTNGFHDAANAIATVVATKVLTARQAVIWGAFWNLIGALGGTAVAKTIGAGLVDTHYVTLMTILGAMIAASTWNIITWLFGLPTSSSHSLLGGLFGAALASSGTWKVLRWSVDKIDAHGHLTHDGIYPKVVVPMVSSPLAGFVAGFILMGVLFAIIRPIRRIVVNALFGRLQILSATYMAWTHGFADGQKTMGVMALAVFVATQTGHLAKLPPALHFLYSPTFEISTWIKWSCGLAMALGTYFGGWKIIKTLGHKLVALKPVHGFAAETTGATILLVTGALGMPVSTTHSITTSIMGVGCARSFKSLDWVITERIVWAWILTIPAAGGLAYVLVKAAALAGFH